MLHAERTKNNHHICGMLKPAAPAVVQTPTQTHIFIPGQPVTYLASHSIDVIFSFLFSIRVFGAYRAHQEGNHIRGHLQPDVPAVAQAALLLPPCCGPAHSPHRLPRYCLSPCPGSAFCPAHVVPFMMSRQCLSPFPGTAFRPAQSVPFTISCMLTAAHTLVQTV